MIKISSPASALALTALFAVPARAIIIASPIVTNSATPFSPSFVASNTVDGTQAEYASAGQGINTFIDYSFGSPQTFDKIVVMNRDSAGFSDLIGNFTLTFDGGPTSASVTRTAIRGVSQLHSLGGVFTATTVHLQVDTIGVGDNFNNTGAMEVIFVRTPAGQSQITGVTIAGSATAFSPFFAATNAVDGDIGRSSAGADGPEYASQSLGTNAFVDFDLGSVRQVGGFDWFDRPASPDRVTGFDMIFSQNATFGDGDDIIRSYTNSGMALGDVFSPLSARFVRYDVTAAAGANTGLTEMIFYAPVPEPTAVGFLSLALLGTVSKRRRR